MALAQSFLGAFNAAASKRDSRDRFGLMQQQQQLAEDQFGFSKEQAALANQQWQKSHGLSQRQVKLQEEADARAQAQYEEALRNRVKVTIGGELGGKSGALNVPGPTDLSGKPVGMVSASLANSTMRPGVEGQPTHLMMGADEYVRYMSALTQDKAISVQSRAQQAAMDEAERQRLAEAASIARYRALSDAALTAEQGSFNVTRPTPGITDPRHLAAVQATNAGQADTLLQRAFQYSRGVDLDGDGVLTDAERFTPQEAQSPEFRQLIQARMDRSGLSTLNDALVQDPTGKGQLRNWFKPEDISRLSSLAENIYGMSGAAFATLPENEAIKMAVGIGMARLNEAATAAEQTGTGL